MYTGFFGLNEKPFSITPDPRYLFLSERHAEALAHLLYGITESGGFIQLTGEVGTGKTTVVRSLLEQLPADTEVALVLNPRLSPHEFLLAICEELRIPLTLDERGSNKAVVDALNRHLLEAHADGRRVVLIVDEAQNLSPDVLEQIRLLTNLETSKQKLLQIILIGQPELRQLLARTDLRQLAQRITGRYHLGPLDRKETSAYIRHRLRVAGGGGETFTSNASNSIHHHARGVPRLINVICDRALLGAYSREQLRVTRGTAVSAAREVSGAREKVGGTGRRLGWAVLVVALLAVAAGLAWVGLDRPQAPLVVVDEPGTLSPVAESRSAPPPAAAARPADPETDAVAATPDAAAPGPASPGLTEPEPAVEEPLPPTLEQILGQRSAYTDTDAAFRTLLGLWGLDYTPAAGRACEVALGAGLRCLYERSSWGFLLNLDRPAILSLSSSDGAQHQVVLSGISKSGDAVLEIGVQRFTVDLGELMPMWLGDFLLVWRPASGSGRILTPGTEGRDVAWLRTSLSQILGEDIPGAPGTYDESLRQSVERFQRSRRLEIDGVAGARTMITLNSAIGLEGRPRLRAGS